MKLSTQSFPNCPKKIEEKGTLSNSFCLERIVSTTNGIEKTGYPHAKE